MVYLYNKYNDVFITTVRKLHRLQCDYTAKTKIYTRAQHTLIHIYTLKAVHTIYTCRHQHDIMKLHKLNQSDRFLSIPATTELRPSRSYI